VAVLAVVGAWAARTWLESSRPVNLLIMGIDDDRTRTDVVVLAHFDPRRQALSLVSLHRDLLVEIPCPNKCLSPDKLAHAHAYGELKDGPGGPQLAIKTVEKLLGIRIDGYVRFDYEGFNKVVDALGGVEIVIDRDMYYEDPYARPPLKIQFTASPAPQRLNGEKALDYVRFREDGRGDVGRIERTQRFFYALYDTARREGSLARVPDLVRAVYPHVKTDISLAMALSLAKAAASVERESIRTATVPGAPVILKDGRWVWAADAAKLQELVDSLLVSPVQARNP
jgi:polyisoprenyl-teichoic acid--peptidoglycan teichoic acid transferase